MALKLDRSITVNPTEESISQVQAFLEETLDQAEVAMKLAMKMDIVLDEVYSNIVFYSKATSVKLECSVNDREIVLQMTDNGIPYNPLEAKEPDITLAAEEREIGGLGIFITKKMMDEFDYKFENNLNCVRLALHL